MHGIFTKLYENISNSKVTNHFQLIMIQGYPELVSFSKSAGKSVFHGQQANHQNLDKKADLRNVFLHKYNIKNRKTKSFFFLIRKL